jgi:hypothetical protein
LLWGPAFVNAGDFENNVSLFLLGVFCEWLFPRCSSCSSLTNQCPEERFWISEVSRFLQLWSVFAIRVVYISVPIELQLQVRWEPLY